MNKINTFTDKEKEKLLILNKWSMTEGWCMDFEKPDDAQNVVISKKEIIKKLSEGFNKFFIQEYGDYFEDLDSAWDDFLDEQYNELDTENDDIVFNELIKQLKERGIKK